MENDEPDKKTPTAWDIQRAKAKANRKRRFVTQADRIIKKFGNAKQLCRLLNEASPNGKTWVPSSIYRWTYPKEKGGTSGVIPTRAMPALIRAARLQGIYLGPEDFYPGPVQGPETWTEEQRAARPPNGLKARRSNSPDKK